MKKIFILLIILVVGFSGIFAQATIAEMETSFSAFSTDIAEALPVASTIGLTWSDAKVRGFPHFGVGISAGAVMIPEDAFVALADSLSITLPSEITDSGFGIPFPTYVIDARVGIPFLPIDIGAKLGVITPDMTSSLSSDVTVDYVLAGFDIRTPILKGNLILPAISLSAGYNYLSGGVNTAVANAGTLTSGINLSSLLAGASINYTDPDVRFEWETQTIDFKLQASKSLLIITPYAGVGYAYGWSKAGGGVSTDITYGGGYTEDQVRAALEAAGYDIELSGAGFTILSESSGGSLRAYGGFSVNLFILKLDLNAMYNLSTQSLGASANVRIAF